MPEARGTCKAAGSHDRKVRVYIHTMQESHYQTREVNTIPTPLGVLDYYKLSIKDNMRYIISVSTDRQAEGALDRACLGVFEESTRQSQPMPDRSYYPSAPTLSSGNTPQGFLCHSCRVPWPNHLDPIAALQLCSQRLWSQIGTTLPACRSPSSRWRFQTDHCNISMMCQVGLRTSPSNACRSVFRRLAWLIYSRGPKSDRTRPESRSLASANRYSEDQKEHLYCWLAIAALKHYSLSLRLPLKSAAW